MTDRLPVYYISLLSAAYLNDIINGGLIINHLSSLCLDFFCCVFHHFLLILSIKTPMNQSWVKSGHQTSGRENHQEGDSGQLEHVCGQSGDQLRWRFNEETWGTLMNCHVFHCYGKLDYSGFTAGMGLSLVTKVSSNCLLCCSEEYSHVPMFIYAHAHRSLRHTYFWMVSHTVYGSIGDTRMNSLFSVYLLFLFLDSHNHRQHISFFQWKL